MAEQQPAPPATELVYVPEPSWTPIFIAAGIMIILMSLFTWWVYGLIGVALLCPRCATGSAAATAMSAACRASSG